MNRSQSPLPNKPQVAIIGAGAAGCLCAIELKRRAPGVDVTLFEAGPQPLAKVAITGGGRCNLTNTFASVQDLRAVYPRGHALMKRLFRSFGPEQTRRWFETEGIRLTEEDGGRIFPASGDAMQIVRMLLRRLQETGVQLCCNQRITDLRPILADFNAVVVTTGGSPKRAGLDFLSPLDLPIVAPVPSLFTLKINDPGLKSLMGTVAPHATLSIPGTAFKASAPLLLTDWGIGGPATLRLSSYAARYLADCDYQTALLVNWTGDTEQQVRQELAEAAASNPHKMAVNTPLSGLSARLWTFLVERSGLRNDIRWAEIGSKGCNRLVATLCQDPYQSCGRASFKEEFVTCGGVSLEALDTATLACKAHPELFLAGEVLDVDAVTGGFNLQAAWTMGWTCARSVASFLEK